MKTWISNGSRRTPCQRRTLFLLALLLASPFFVPVARAASGYQQAQAYHPATNHDDPQQSVAALAARFARLQQQLADAQRRENQATDQLLAQRADAAKLKQLQDELTKRERDVTQKEAAQARKDEEQRQKDEEQRKKDEEQQLKNAGQAKEDQDLANREAKVKEDQGRLDKQQAAFDKQVQTQNAVEKETQREAQSKLDDRKQVQDVREHQLDDREASETQHEKTSRDLFFPWALAGGVGVAALGLGLGWKLARWLQPVPPVPPVAPVLGVIGSLETEVDLSDWAITSPAPGAAAESAPGMRLRGSLEWGEAEQPLSVVVTEEIRDERA